MALATALANTITGNAGANTIDGAGGGDIMRGLAGNDTYVVDDLGDVVDESVVGSGGTDTVLSFVNINLGGGTAKFVSLAPLRPAGLALSRTSRSRAAPSRPPVTTSPTSSPATRGLISSTEATLRFA